MKDELSRSPARRLVLLLLVLAGGVIAAGQVLMGGLSAKEVPPNWVPPPDTVHMKVDQARYVLTDKDEDGSVDCAVRAGRSALGGLSAFRRSGGPRCTPLDLFTKPMPAKMRAALSHLFREKRDLGLGAAMPTDQNEDGTADCLVSVFVTDRVLAERSPGRCGRVAIGTPRTTDWARVDALLQAEVAARAALDEER